MTTSRIGLLIIDKFRVLVHTKTIFKNDMLRKAKNEKVLNDCLNKYSLKQLHRKVDD